MTDELYLLRSTTLSYVQYTDNRIKVHHQSWYRTYNGVRLSRSDVKVIEILKKDLPLLCND